MTWNIVWKPPALRDFLRLDGSVQDRIERSLERARQNPERAFKPLADTALRSMRVGDYRVLAVLRGTIRVVLIERVGHRSVVYDR